MKDTIKRILREGGFVPLPIRRRISTDDLEEAFAYSLETNATHMDNPNTVLYKEKKPSLWVFSKFVIDDMITLIEQEYFTNDNRIYFSDTEEDDKTYHEKIRQPLLRYYGKRIKEKYDEVMSSNDEEIIQESIRRILREETNQKNEGLFNLINDLGLYGFMEDMGLNYSEIVFKIGELPREIKIQYIKDVVNNLEQTPGELDLSYTIGSIPLFIDEDDNTVYVESIYNRNNKLKFYTYITTEDGYDDYNVIYEDDLDYETLDTLVAELSEKLQHNRN